MSLPKWGEAVSGEHEEAAEVSDMSPRGHTTETSDVEGAPDASESDEGASGPDGLVERVLEGDGEAGVAHGEVLGAPETTRVPASLDAATSDPVLVVGPVVSVARPNRWIPTLVGSLAGIALGFVAGRSTAPRSPQSDARGGPVALASVAQVPQATRGVDPSAARVTDPAGRRGARSVPEVAPAVPREASGSALQPASPEDQTRGSASPADPPAADDPVGGASLAVATTDATEAVDAVIAAQPAGPAPAKTDAAGSAPTESAAPETAAAASAPAEPTAASDRGDVAATAAAEDQGSGDVELLRRVPEGTDARAAKRFRNRTLVPGDRPPLVGVGAGGVHVDRIEVGKKRRGQGCVPKDTSFQIGVDREVVVCFRVVLAPKGERLVLRWLRDGDTQRRAFLPLKGTRVRTGRVRMPLRPGSAGNWTMEVRTRRGVLLAQAPFEISAGSQP